MAPICYHARPVLTFFQPRGLLIDVVVAACAGFALLGCDAGAAPASPDVVAPRRERTSSVDPKTAGSVAVRVRFAGTPQPPETMSLKGDAACCRNGNEKSVRTVQVSADGSLANAFVWVRAGLEGFAFDVPNEPVVVDQRGCLFEPRVVGVRAGQPIRLLNSDDTLHNVHAIAERNRAFNFGFPEAGSERLVTFRTPEVMIQLRCHVHEWMAAWVGVVDHPCFSVTGDSGTALLRPMPPGEYEVAAWHEKLGIRSQRVTIAPSETASVELVFEVK
ncbi:MAG: hypothetical protein HY292_22610 [Planctomycetes bacterium]|nr:hypothetical protein [Planctomycetota bacterium]